MTRTDAAEVNPSLMDDDRDLLIVEEKYPAACAIKRLRLPQYDDSQRLLSQLVSATTRLTTLLNQRHQPGFMKHHD